MRRITILASALACALGMVGTDALAGEGLDPAAAWKHYMASTAYDAANGAYQVLGRVHYDGTHVDAASCRSESAALAKAVDTVPVGLALHHAAMLCAEALGDAGAAERELQAVGALSRHALAEAGTGAWAPPIRIARPEDIDAFATAAGLERRYGYFGQLHAMRTFPLVVVMYDPEKRTERHMAFDWVEPLASLVHEGEYDGYPFERFAIARAFVDSWAGDGDVPYVDAQALQAAWEEQDVATKRDRLRAGAGRGGLMSVQGWLEVCRLNTLPGCSDGLVDALLPSAEAGQGLARLLLAVAYLDGAGVAKDEDAARRLVEAADATWDGNGASTYLGALLVQRGQPWPAWLQARLAAASASGNPNARAMLIAYRVGTGAAIDAADRTFLEAPANNRQGRGLALLAGMEEANKTADASGLRRRAAQAGDADSMFLQALGLLQTTPDDPAGLDGMRAAALAGSIDAARYMAYTEAEHARWSRARAWLLSGVVAGDLDTALALASLYQEGVPETGGSPADARGIYEQLATSSPEARRRLATMLADGEGGPTDARRARILLEQDARQGDVTSQLLLGGGLLDGRLGPVDARAGRDWLEKAVASGDPDAKSDYGTWLIRNEKTPQGRARGVRLLREADTPEASHGTNNLAWLLCVAPQDDVRDPKAGLEVALRMGDAATIDPGSADTIAACHAAVGDFARAAHVQAQVIERIPPTTRNATMLERMRERLALYVASKPYIERMAERD